MLVRLQRELFPLHASHRQRKHHLPVVFIPIKPLLHSSYSILRPINQINN